MEEELYSGQIKNDEELAERARELGATLQISDGREKVRRRGDLLVGEVTEISLKLSRRRRIYLAPGASLQVDITNDEVRIKAWGLLAHVFQHETDHLGGTLFTDRTKQVYESPTTTRLKEREKNIK